MSQKRRQYSASFKAKVAVAALKGDMTISEIAARYEIHPTMVSGWKKDLIDGATDIFNNKSGKTAKNKQQEVDNLYRQIGQLTVERDFLERKLDH